MELTSDQQNIFALLAGRKCFRVIAHAGTGKTTGLLCALRELERSGDGRSVLFLEYNRNLKKDAQAKAAEFSCQNVRVSNFDSVLKHHYEEAAPSIGFGLALYKVLKEKKIPRQSLDFDVLVVDEAQDMHAQYLQFVLKLLNDAGGDKQLVLVGDPKQTIYGFRRASSAFLTGDERMWNSYVPTETVYLKRTFRFGSTICSLINDIFRSRFDATAWGKDIESGFSEGDIVVWHLSPKTNVDSVAAFYKDACVGALRDGKSVAVLSGSIKHENAFLWTVIERAQENGAPLVAPFVLKDHPEIYTIYCTKGREFDVVFLFVGGKYWRGFPELLYVGLTRARRRVVVIYEDRTLDGDIFSSAWCEARRVEYHAPPENRRRLSKNYRDVPLYANRDIETKLEVEEVANLASRRVLTARPLQIEPVPSLTNEIALLALQLRVKNAKPEFPAQDSRVLIALLAGENAQGGLKDAIRQLAGRDVPVLPRLRQKLCDLPRNVDSWTCREWCALAMATPEQHFGHAEGVWPTPEDFDAADALYDNFRALFQNQSGHSPGTRPSFAQCKPLIATDDPVCKEDGACSLVELALQDGGIPLKHTLAALALRTIDRFAKVNLVLLQNAQVVEIGFREDEELLLKRVKESMK